MTSPAAPDAPDAPETPRPPGDAHPSAYALEAASAGAPDDATSAHLAACAPCAAHVDALRAAAARFLEARPPRPFVARLAPPRAAWAPAKIVAWAAPLAVAAAVLLFVGRPGAPLSAGDGPATASSPGPVRFKGTDVALRVVRAREGRQERLATSFDVREGDALRLEITVASRAAVAAGVLEDDGTWTPLLPPTELDPGPRFVDDAVRVDAHPTGGTFLAGAPEAVEHARRSGSLEGVVTLRFAPAPR